MADVGAHRLATKPSSRDRGQILILTALLLAVTLVLLAVLLNGVIYSENIGSRGADIGGSEVASFDQSVERTGNELIRAINDGADDTDDTGTLEPKFEESIIDWHEQSRLHYSASGSHTGVTYEDSSFVGGTQIIQSDDREFRDNGWGDPGWQLANDVEARDFVIEINEESLIDESSANDIDTTDAFRITLSDEDEWTVYFYSDDSNEIRIVAEDDGEPTDVCDAAEGSVATVNFAEGTVDGEPCDAVTVPGRLNSYDIDYEYGDNAVGTYRLVVNDEALVDDEKYGDEGADLASLPAIYSVELEVTYEGRQIGYEATIKIAPGELNE